MQNRIKALAQKTRDHAVPFLRNEFTFAVDAVAHLIAKINFKPNDRSIIGAFVERRICGLGREFDNVVSGSANGCQCKNYTCKGGFFETV